MSSRRRGGLVGVVARILVNALGIFLAGRVVPGVSFHGSVAQLLLAGFLFGVLNASVKPLVVLLALPLIVVTLGLAYLVINGLMVLAVAALIPSLRVAGLAPAILASLFMGLVNLAVSVTLRNWM